MSVRSTSRKTHKTLYDTIEALSRYIDISSFLNSKNVPCVASSDSDPCILELVKFAQKHKDENLAIVCFLDIEYIFVGHIPDVTKLLLKELEEVKKDV